MTATLAAQVVVIGGGIAGLWTLACLREAGIDAVLLESSALGRGQTVQAQGIVHGGGKYALRKVGDLAAIEAIREMPDRWREHHAGRRTPSLAGSELLSPHCYLWLPRGQWRARIESWGLLPMLRHGRILNCPPLPVDMPDWPSVLRDSALRVYRMAEPVFSTVSVQTTLAAGLQDHLYCIDARAEACAVERDADGRWKSVRVGIPDQAGTLVVEADAFVLTAGEGNARWMELGGHREELMQRRPLLMFLLRGVLPALHGHCFLGGRTRMTITSLDLSEGRRVWQLGGEVAERHADSEDPEVAMRECWQELRTVLPAFDPRGAEMSHYRAVRAERSRPDHRRPGGVQVEHIATNAWATWPTKWALAPVLAEEIRAEIQAMGPAPTTAGQRPSPWPRPEVAKPPWEEVLPWSVAPWAAAV